MAELSRYSSIANITNSLGYQGQIKFRLRILVFPKHNTVEDEIEQEMPTRNGSK